MMAQTKSKSQHVKSQERPRRGGNRRESSADMIDAKLRQTEALRLRQAGHTFALWLDGCRAVALITVGKILEARQVRPNSDKKSETKRDGFGGIRRKRDGGV